MFKITFEFVPDVKRLDFLIVTKLAILTIHFFLPPLQMSSSSSSFVLLAPIKAYHTYCIHAAVNATAAFISPFKNIRIKLQNIAQDISFGLLN